MSSEDKNGERRNRKTSATPLSPRVSCDKYKETGQQPKLNPNAPAFRQQRDAAVAANERIQEVLELEQ